MSPSTATIAALRSAQRAAPAPPEPRGSQYSRLLRQVRDVGLLERRSAYYVWKIVVTAVLLAAGWAAFVLIGDSWWQLATGAFLAFVFTQIGFIGHDAGHRQIFSSRKANYVLGILHANLAIGLSYGWWIDKHNRHHAHPNQQGKDPDIERGALAFTTRQAASRGRVLRLLYHYQAYLFLPLLLLEGVSLHVASIRALIGRAGRGRLWEATLFAAHVAGYFTAVFLVLSPLRAIAFIVVQQGLFGLYLGSSFAPNHKGMAMLDADDRTNFLRRQVLTSHNVRSNRVVDFALGGLNYQIEHHLFPSLPRPNPRHAQTLVQRFCAENDLVYTQTSLADSYRQVLGHLHAAGRPASCHSNLIMVGDDGVTVRARARRADYPDCGARRSRGHGNDHQRGAGAGGLGREDGMAIGVPSDGAWGPLRLVARFPAPGTARIAVAGEIDLATAGLVRDALLALVRDRALTMVDADLSELRFLDCAGIGALVAVYAAAARGGGRLVIGDPQPPVRKVLELTGVLALLTLPADRPPTANTSDSSPR